MEDRRTMKIVVALAALSLPPAAHAASRAETVLEQFRAEAAARPPTPLTTPLTSSAARLAEPRLFLARADDGPARPKGTVQTAVDVRFNPKATGSLGYLCGLQPGPNDRGGVRSSSDPAGTFLGGQFKVAF
jgi:hypothetical protein